MTDLIVNFADQLHRDKNFTKAEQQLILATLAQVQFQMEQFRNLKIVTRIGNKDNSLANLTLADKRILHKRTA